MKIAICFYGECPFMDRFMIQNFTRCIIVPLQKYIPDKVEFFFIFHSYMDNEMLSIIEKMKTFFPFTVLTLHNKDFVLREVVDNVSLYLQDYSLQRVKRMWKRCMLSLDLIICSRLDLLFSRPLSEGDIEAMILLKNHLFVSNTSHDLQQCFVAGDPFVMNIYTERLHYVEDHGTDFSIADLVQIHPTIKINTLSTVFVRILQDGIVHPSDFQVSPYLNDLIKSSNTVISLRKMNLKMKTNILKKKEV